MDIHHRAAGIAREFSHHSSPHLSGIVIGKSHAVHHKAIAEVVGSPLRHSLRRHAEEQKQYEDKTHHFTESVSLRKLLNCGMK